ncbi:MAG: hypothetical protein EOP34_01665 [Rickettsiales bacterium]|nr:MAG: hypothetical protein EOP34_01665 [Rickettsiales bacterium]
MKKNIDEENKRKEKFENKLELYMQHIDESVKLNSNYEFMDHRIVTQHHENLQREKQRVGNDSHTRRVEESKKKDSSCHIL